MPWYRKAADREGTDTIHGNDVAPTLPIPLPSFIIITSNQLNNNKPSA